MYKFWLSRSERKELNRQESIRKGKELLKYSFDCFSPIPFGTRMDIQDELEKLKVGDDKYETFWNYRPR